MVQGGKGQTTGRGSDHVARIEEKQEPEATRQAEESGSQSEDRSDRESHKDAPLGAINQGKGSRLKGR